MKLSAFKEFINYFNWENDPDIIIELEDKGCMRFTGVIRSYLYKGADDTPYICLLPTACLKREPLEKVGMQGVTCEEKSALWRNR